MPRALRVAGRAIVFVALALVGAWFATILLYRSVDPPLTPLMLLRLAEGARIDYRPRPIAAVSADLANAVIAAEDNRFCEHHGVDWQAVDEAIEDYEEGKELRGASTITMQTARNLFLWPGGGFVRKAAETGLAYALELLWPKRRILEVYLNVVEWGDGIYGAEAAARAHFAKPPDRLNRQQAVLLAAALPNPRRWAAGRPTAYLARRAAMIRARLDQLGPLLACVR